MGSRPLIVRREALLGRQRHRCDHDLHGGRSCNRWVCRPCANPAIVSS